MNRFTEDYCKAVAMSCETTSEFRKKYPAVAMKAQKMGWYESYTWLRMDRVPRNYWTYKTCKAEASKYKTLKEFRVKSPSAYVIANKKGWASSFTFLERHNSMENKTGILLITSDRMFGTKDGASYTESKCVTIDKCLESLCAYMQKVADYHPNGLWTYENGMLVTPSDACKMTQRKYESYDRLACHNMVPYRFTYRVATCELLSVVTMIFNDFYKV